MKGLREDGTIGLLLDLEEGTLTVYKNGRRLGAMKTGLSGEYCWYTSLINLGKTVQCQSREARCLKELVTTAITWQSKIEVIRVKNHLSLHGSGEFTHNYASFGRQLLNEDACFQKI